MKFLDAVKENGEIVVRLGEAPVPVPGTGEVLIRVTASGVNRADLSQFAGQYPPPPGEPEIPGLEVSGILEETGEGVCALLAGGGHAQYVAAPLGQVFPLPRSVDPVSGAAIPEAFMTAYLNLSREANLKKGETVLIRAGASGVGLAAIQMARLLGARVAATTRSAAKLPALQQAGAELAIDGSAGAISTGIEARWGRECVHLILDPVGASTLAEDLQLLATGGRIVFLSTMGGARGELDISLLMKKRGRLIGSTLRSRSRREKEIIVAGFREEVLPAFDAGKLSVWMDSLFSPEEAASAFARMRENKNVGKILINWRGEGKIRGNEPAGN